MPNKEIYGCNKNNCLSNNCYGRNCSVSPCYGKNCKGGDCFGQGCQASDCFGSNCVAGDCYGYKCIPGTCFDTICDPINCPQINKQCSDGKAYKLKKKMSNLFRSNSIFNPPLCDKITNNDINIISNLLPHKIKNNITRNENCELCIGNKCIT